MFKKVHGIHKYYDYDIEDIYLCINLCLLFTKLTTYYKYMINYKNH